MGYIEEEYDIEIDEIAETSALKGYVWTNSGLAPGYERVIPEALAAMVEVAHRTLELRPYPVQMMGAMALNDGYPAEMATGEEEPDSLFPSRPRGVARPAQPFCDRQGLPGKPGCRRNASVL